MKNSELRALSVEELEKKLVVEKENLEKLIFSHAATPIENPMRIKVARMHGRPNSHTPTHAIEDESMRLSMSDQDARTDSRRSLRRAHV